MKYVDLKKKAPGSFSDASITASDERGGWQNDARLSTGVWGKLLSDCQAPGPRTGDGSLRACAKHFLLSSCCVVSGLFQQQNINILRLIWGRRSICCLVRFFTALEMQRVKQEVKQNAKKDKANWFGNNILTNLKCFTNCIIAHTLMVLTLISLVIPGTKCSLGHCLNKPTYVTLKSYFSSQRNSWKK